jgi:hypothetical protein
VPVDARESLDHLLGRPALDLAGDPPVAKHDHPLGDRGGRRIVGDQDQRLALGAVQLTQQLEDLGARVGVEVARRLVGKHQLRFREKRTRHRDPLLLSARQLRGQMPEAVR